MLEKLDRAYYEQAQFYHNKSNLSISTGPIIIKPNVKRKKDFFYGIWDVAIANQAQPGPLMKKTHLLFEKLGLTYNERAHLKPGAYYRPNSADYLN